MEELINKLKEYMSKLDNRRFINKLLIILIVTVTLLILINLFTSSNQKEQGKVIKKDPDEYNKQMELDYSVVLENKLENILEKLADVGKVNVMITLDDSIEKIPAANITKYKETTDETDSQGGIRKTIREEENKQLLDKSEDILVLKEIQPNIKGVIVIAEGAENGEILERLYNAVQTVLGISSNKVQVFPSK